MESKSEWRSRQREEEDTDLEQTQAGLKRNRMLIVTERLGRGTIAEQKRSLYARGEGGGGQELHFCFCCDHRHCATLLWKHCDIMLEVDTKL